MKNQFSFENVIKIFGEINKNIYGINPYEKKESKEYQAENITLETEREEDLTEEHCPCCHQGGSIAIHDHCKTKSELEELRYLQNHE